jgi:exosortase D (VPLPA-CTERM-specific)
MPLLTVPQTQVTTSRTAILLFLAVVAAIIGFHDTLLNLVTRWSRQEEYSHGFLIPVVVVWLLWARRDAVRAAIGRPSWTGVVLVVVALLMNLIGQLSAIFILSQVGFVVALIGIVLAVGGYPLLRVTLMPIVFLLFAIPFPYFVDAVLTLQLQLISSELGAFFIGIFQIPVYLDGNVIDLGNYKLAVVEACSGLRYLYPLLSLSFLAAYLFQAPIWQRAVVFLSAVPITIVMNSLRIGMAGVLVSAWGTKQAEGLLHLFEGWVIFIACATLLAGEIFLFARLSGKTFSEVFHAPVFKTRPKRQLKSISDLPIAACLATLIVAGLAISVVSNRSEILPERSRFAAFPLRLGPWQGHPSLLERDREHGLKLDDYMLSDYSMPDRKPVNLYVAYYASQRLGESPHSPIVCIPGSGWQITKFERTTDGAVDYPRPLNRVIIAKDSQRMLVYYWFDERGRTIANEWWAKWYLFADAILMNRTDGALVRLITEIPPSESERDADNRLHSFMQRVVPALDAYLPTREAPPIKMVLSQP